MPPVRPFVHAVGEDRYVEGVEANRGVFRLPRHAAADLAVGPVAVSANWRGMTIISEDSWKPNSMVRP
jgi:hypothetical protein